MSTAAMVFEQAMEWLQNYYGVYHKERDIVLAIRDHLNEVFDERNLRSKARDEFKMPTGKIADIVIRRLESDEVEVAAEFKYEPSHTRKSEFSQGAFPVTFWDEIGNDVSKVFKYVADGHARVAYAVFVDEGRYHRWRECPPRSDWKDWENSSHHPYSISLLWTRAPADGTTDRLD